MSSLVYCAFSSIPHDYSETLPGTTPFAIPAMELCVVGTILFWKGQPPLDYKENARVLEFNAFWMDLTNRLS